MKKSFAEKAAVFNAVADNDCVVRKRFLKKNVLSSILSVKSLMPVISLNIQAKGR